MNYNTAELCKDCKMPVVKNARQVAMTIKRQIGVSTLMELGAHKFFSLNPISGMRGGLEFRFKYKSNRTGLASVVLRSDDTYSVIMMNAKRQRVINKKGIYADQLSRILRDGFKQTRLE